MLTRNEPDTSPATDWRMSGAGERSAAWPGSWRGRTAFWLVPAIYVLCLATFIADTTSFGTQAIGVIYVPLVATSVYYRDKRAVWILCALACVMVTVGTVIRSTETNVSGIWVNRVLSVCAVIATAIFVRHARAVQDRLAAQTSRAEAAEDISAQVLTNLRQEILARLHGMINVLEFVAADSRGDQKMALGIARTAGRHLISTIDNLVDLAQFEDRPMRIEPVDLGQLIRRTAETRLSDARARQIRLTLDIAPDSGAVVHANPWAVSRILENLIGDAISYTAPGGQVVIRTTVEPDRISAVITDTGTRPPGALHLARDPGIARLTPSAMGLSLSRRLARATAAELVVRSGPEDGTTAHLRLRGAPRANRNGA